MFASRTLDDCKPLQLGLPVRHQRHDVINDPLAAAQRCFEAVLQELHAIPGSARLGAPIA